MERPNRRTHLSRIHTFCFSSDAVARGRAALAAEPAAQFRLLVDDKESEHVLYAAKAILDTCLAGELVAPAFCMPAFTTTTELLASLIAQVHAAGSELALLRARVEAAPAEAKRRAWIERAPVGLVRGCWLEGVSQPATQPAELVNRIYRQYLRDTADGAPDASHEARYARSLQARGVLVPALSALHFTALREVSAFTWVFGTFALSLARFPANYFPELLGVNWVIRTLDVDGLLGITGAASDAEEALAIAHAHLLELERLPAALAEALRARFVRGVGLAVALERAHARHLGALIDWYAGGSLETQVAEIIARHAPLAGKHHRSLRVAGERMVDTFACADFDAERFTRALKQSAFVRPRRDGTCRFLEALRFEGSMFGVFDAEEAAVLRTWALSGPHQSESAAPMPKPPVELARYRDALAACTPHGLRVATVHDDGDERHLLHMLVNLENHPAVLAVARRRVERALARARRLFDASAPTRHTDPRFFEYSVKALEARFHDIYWTKLVGPHEALSRIPSREEVVENQKLAALGNLIDGAWLQRLYTIGRRGRWSDGRLFSIYADEMGRGDPRKNHITLAYRALESMGVKLPHLSDVEFIDQSELADELYAFAIFQLSLAAFPDSFYPEIIGYNLAIEMYGLGAMRMHEIEKLAHWGFDTAYERTHLSIDNASAGHARVSLDITTWYLERVAREFGEAAMRTQWERVWSGYASFAQFVELGSVRETSRDDVLDLTL